MKRAKRTHTYFNPSDFRSYLARRLGKPESYVTIPSEVLFTYDRRIFNAATSVATASPIDWYIYSGRLFTRRLTKRDIAVVHALLGASAAAMNLEELIAYGAKRIFEVGVSGAIDKTLSPGDVVLLNGAISDEGTSKHYYQNAGSFEPSTKLTEKLKATLKSKRIKYVTGKAWTTDAPYRETKEKVAAHLARGARVVNMESSAIFAIGSYRGIETASVQVVSDIVSETWEPAFHTEIVNEARMKVLDAVLAAADG